MTQDRFVGIREFTLFGGMVRGYWTLGRRVPRKQLKWDEPAEPTKIVGPIYSIGTKGLSVFLIRTNDGLIVINTAMPGSGPMTEAAIRKLGFHPKDIRLLLAGHAHSDHVGAHAYLKRISGARIATIKEEKDLFESGGKLDFHYAKYPEFDYEPARSARSRGKGGSLEGRGCQAMGRPGGLPSLARRSA